MHSAGLTQALAPCRHAKISTSAAVNINVQLSPSPDSGGHAASLKCNPFLHVAASFSKDTKLIWGQNWPRHISVHSRKVIALDSWVMTSDYDPQRHFYLHGANDSRGVPPCYRVSSSHTQTILPSEVTPLPKKDENGVVCIRRMCIRVTQELVWKRK